MYCTCASHLYIAALHHALPVCTECVHCGHALRPCISTMHHSCTLHLCIVAMHCTHALHPCITAVPCTCASRPCIASIHCTHASWPCPAAVHCSCALHVCIATTHCIHASGQYSARVDGGHVSHRRSAAVRRMPSHDGSQPAATSAAAGLVSRLIKNLSGEQNGAEGIWQTSSPRPGARQLSCTNAGPGVKRHARGRGGEDALHPPQPSPSPAKQPFPLGATLQHPPHPAATHSTSCSPNGRNRSIFPPHTAPWATAGSELQPPARTAPDFSVNPSAGGYSLPPAPQHPRHGNAPAGNGSLLGHNLCAQPCWRRDPRRKTPPLRALGNQRESSGRWQKKTPVPQLIASLPPNRPESPGRVGASPRSVQLLCPRGELPDGTTPLLAPRGRSSPRRSVYLLLVLRP